MFKHKAFVLTAVITLTALQNITLANWENFEVTETPSAAKTLKATWASATSSQKVILESAAANSLNDYVQTLANLPVKEAYPEVNGAESRFKAQNIDRQINGNLYHLYSVTLQDQNTSGFRAGFVQFGRMPTKGYTEGIEGNPEAHHPIIQKWIDLGLTRKKSQELLDDANIERIDNRGAAMVLPLLNHDLSNDTKNAVIEASFELVRSLKARNALLPVENTLPYIAFALLTPQDPLVKTFHMQAFKLDDSKGFGWFYPRDTQPRPRVMITRRLDH